MEDLLDITEERADFEEHRANTQETRANIEQRRANVEHERANMDHDRENRTRTYLMLSCEKVEGHGDWDAPEYTDTAGSKEKKVTKALSFNKVETKK
nr:hypothetical protein [Tanacetum cinerariifolium]